MPLSVPDKVLLAHIYQSHISRPWSSSHITY
ncbi:hypothetical protein F383_26968 [Gossypium arboreum]|uniref:Uncharacterized protein n=1 Tax=Gossypium arboreum TaxID=29729 RepID=A0A0B0P9L9_GOSAR|nr:hypothetical protein F383_26968 [Gossypium arboreum]